MEQDKGGVCMLTICDTDLVDNDFLEIKLGAAANFAVFQLRHQDELLRPIVPCNATGFDGAYCSCTANEEAESVVICQDTDIESGDGKLCSNANVATFKLATIIADLNDEEVVEIEYIIGASVGLTLVILLAVFGLRRRTKWKTEVGTRLTLSRYDSRNASMFEHYSASATMRSGVSRDTLRTAYSRFRVKRSDTKLSSLLHDSFSVKSAFDLLHQSPSTDGFDLRSYRSTMTRADAAMYHNKKETVRLSQNLQRLDELLGLSQSEDLRPGVVAKPTLKPNWKTKAKRLVKKVSSRLDQQILNAEEIQAIEKSETRKRAKKRKGAAGPGAKASKDSPLSRFTNTTPEVTLERYLFRLVTALSRWFSEDAPNEVVGIRCLLISLVYLQKIWAIEPDFTLTVFNVHRLFSIMMLISAKFSEDELISNQYWADICGIGLAELNRLENDFCLSSGFNFYVDPDDLNQLYVEFGLSQFIGASCSKKKQSSKGASSFQYSL